MNRKIFALTFTSLAVAVGLLMANQWLSNQIDDLSHTSRQVEQVYQRPEPVVAVKPKPVQKAKIEIVPTFQIDPGRDPLAPAEKKKPKPEKAQVTKKKPKPRYDTPPRDLILPQ